MRSKLKINEKELLEDYKKVKQGLITKSDVMKKYNMGSTTYKNKKREFVYNKGVDIREIYRESDINKHNKLKKYAEKNSKLNPVDNSKDIEDIKHGVYFVKGKSTLLDENGNVKLTWVKETLDENDYLNGLKEAIKDLVKELPLAPKINKSVKHNDDSLMTLLPIPDLHLGMYIDKNEVNNGYDWNLEIAEHYFNTAMDYLLNASPNSKECVIVDLGDVLHVDDNDNRTKKSNHVLSTSDRYAKVLKTLIKIMKDTVSKALEKFDKVYFYSVPGNHNSTAFLTLKMVLAHNFQNNNRVFINDETYTAIDYHKFGKNLLQFFHGDYLRPEYCDKTLVADNLSEISNFKYFNAYCGHFHQEKKFECGIVNVNIMKPLIPCEAWSSAMGFRATPGLAKAIIFHKDFGPISEITHQYGLKIK